MRGPLKRREVCYPKGVLKAQTVTTTGEFEDGAWNASTWVATMANSTLTDVKLRSLKPASSDRLEIWDAQLPGFGVRVSPPAPSRLSCSTACTDARGR